MSFGLESSLIEAHVFALPPKLEPMRSLTLVALLLNDAKAKSNEPLKP
jgi:hypothetical protein